MKLCIPFPDVKKVTTMITKTTCLRAQKCMMTIIGSKEQGKEVACVFFFFLVIPASCFLLHALTGRQAAGLSGARLDTPICIDGFTVGLRGDPRALEYRISS